ncbi:MAG: conjugative relaxase [Blastomonas fulva]|uniref:MobF family relaxase n=1 Tax=Blastomonas fulva TaxID=1550728 RepID=UPI0024E26338|nr:MobF family relaxase [Blastomonas fulva]MDK2759627.1 conjugative relaxase [Blastomonas fulva]
MASTARAQHPITTASPGTSRSNNYERSRSGEPQKTGNLVYALFAHDTSRALDPQGHIHAVVANLTRDPKGTWKALWNGEIWKNNTTIGQFYHAAFRAQLQKLGYETEAAGKHGSFEIKGVPSEVIKEFSQRREDILTKVAELGIASPQGQDRVTVNTRDPKLAVEDRAALAEAWQDRAVALGFDGTTLIAEARARAEVQARPTFRETATAALGEISTRIGAALRTPSSLAVSGAAALFLPADTIKAQHATASAIRHLSEREAAFSPQAILSAALGFQIKGLEGSAVVERIGELIREGHLIPGKSERLDGHFDLVTTPAALAMEQKILDTIDRGQGEGRVRAPSNASCSPIRRIEATAARSPRSMIYSDLRASKPTRSRDDIRQTRAERTTTCSIPCSCARRVARSIASDMRQSKPAEPPLSPFALSKK